MQVFCDFDGTISVKDTTDEILSRFADPEWEIIEAEWKRGEIGSAECMRRQIALIRATQTELDAALDAVPIDPAFPAFVRFCAAQEIPVTVISDGVDYFIHRILVRYGLDYLPVIANHLTVVGGNHYQLSSPYTNPACDTAAGVCKCRQIGARTGTRVFVGDGRSDFCAAGSADIIFAKTALAVYCEQENIPYTPYHNFSDVQQRLESDFCAHLQPAAQYHEKRYAVQG